MTNTKITAVPVRNIKKGDTFVDDGRSVWTAFADAKTDATGTVLRVQFPDGGLDFRQWDDADHALPIRREA